MIPIGIYCPPFVGMTSGMQYVSGINPLFEALTQVKLDYHFLNFGFKSNFLSNVNLMVLIIAACPIISGILIFIGSKNTSYKMKPRLIKYGKSFML